MPIIRRIPASQCNAPKTISALKDLFAEQGIPEVLCTDNSPQFANGLFTKFATDWKFDHNTSSPGNPRNNGQAEAAVKTVKGLLTCAKCSGQDPNLALLCLLAFTCRNAIPASTTHHCTKTDQAH